MRGSKLVGREHVAQKASAVLSRQSLHAEHRSGLARVLSCIVFASAAVYGVPPGLLPAQAQEAVDTSTIRTVQVEGNQRIESRTIQSYMLVEPGDPFDPERLDLSLKALFATGLFVDINFTRSGDDLIVRVIENPVISRVLFEGNSSLSDDKLREEIQAAPRGIFTPARIQQDVRRMLELYRQDGRFGVKIEPQYKPLSQNRVDVIFSIEEGPRTGVRAINFIGNRAFSDDRLRQEIATKQSRLWRIFSSNDNYDPGRLEFDREQLRQLYQNRGYYDFRVISAVADLTPDQSDFYVTFTIEEGEQYTFGEFDIVTSFDRLDAERLKPLITARPGELYRGNMIEDTIDALTFAAGIAGYAFVDIRPQITADPETRTVNVTFAIDEGPRVYIDRININGNTNTLDRVIRRELRISEGDPYNRVLMERSRNRVRALRFFRSVELEEEPSTTPDRTIVNINVEETPTGEVSFAAGFSSTESFLIDLSIAQRNLVGTGRSGVARLSLSGQQQQLNFQFTEPRLFDRNLSGGVDLFAVRNDFLDQANFESTTIGTGVRVGFPVSERVQMGLRYRLQLDDIGIQDRNIIIDDEGELVASTIQNDDGTTREPEIGDVIDPENQLVDICDPLYRLRDASCASERSDLASIVGYSLNFDGRNDPIEPTGGFDFGFSQDIAGAGGDVRYLRTEVSSGWYRGLFRGVRAQARFSAGHILPWGGDEGVLINNRFFRGGSNFRGFDVAGLGPREVIRLFDPDTGEETELQRGNALGGTLYYQSTFEVTMPNFLPEEYGIKSALFLEAGGVGNLYDADYNDPLFFTDASGDDGVQFVETDPSLRASAGLTVFWTSPFGPIQFDFSHILKREDYDRTENFRFSTSTRF